MSDDHDQHTPPARSPMPSAADCPTHFRRREFLQVTSAGALSTSAWWAVTAKTDALADGQNVVALSSGEGSEIDYPYFTD